jgi:glutamate synthase (NADPH/NADH) small chain
MGDPRGFLRAARAETPLRPVPERTADWSEIHDHLPRDRAREQASRCMDCGVPFCHSACPLGNLIPEWNDLAYRGAWREAVDRLHATNNFPEFTGRICPAPCEPACVVAIHGPPVSVKTVELSVVDEAFRRGWIVPRPPARETGLGVAVVGSGPSGLAAAQQLRRAGHRVTVFERADRIGGLLTYGIPDFKLDKRVVQRRIDLIAAEGVVFKTGIEVGRDLPFDDLKAAFDAVLLCGGATQARELTVPGRYLRGVHLAMEYLTLQNKFNAGDAVDPIDARGKAVLIVGGGDTGADCLGTALRQRARSVVQLELLPRPPAQRPPNNPWPEWPKVLRTSPAHEEGGRREFAVQTIRLSGTDGRVARAHAVRLDWSRTPPRPVPGSEFELEADLVLLAMGFVGPERSSLLEQAGVRMTERGTVWTGADKMTSAPGVFAAGDMARGQSLVVWAIAEGRAAAAGVDRWLATRAGYGRRLKT